MVYLPIDGSGLTRGDTVPADKVHVQAQDIDIMALDAMAMRDPRDGNAIGDAVFDPMAVDDPDAVNICDSML